MFISNSRNKNEYYCNPQLNNEMWSTLTTISAIIFWYTDLRFTIDTLTSTIAHPSPNFSALRIFAVPKCLWTRETGLSNRFCVALADDDDDVGPRQQRPYTFLYFSCTSRLNRSCPITCCSVIVRSFYRSHSYQTFFYYFLLILFFENLLV